MTEISVTRDGTLNLQLSVTGAGPVTGLSPVVELYDPATGLYLDFDDLTFKADGARVQPTDVLPELGGGLYLLAFDMSTITNLPLSTKSLIARYEVTDAGFEGVDHDVVQIDETFSKVCEIFADLYNKKVVNFGTQELELYDETGTVVIQRWPLETDGGEAVSTQFGVQTVREVPIL